jgi:hypothetical protein
MPYHVCMTTREIIGVAIILVAAIGLLLATMGQANREIGIASSAICVAVPALLGYVQMQRAKKRDQDS